MPLERMRQVQLDCPAHSPIGRASGEASDLTGQALDLKMILFVLACLIIRVGDDQNLSLANLSQYET